MDPMLREAIAQRDHNNWCKRDHNNWCNRQDSYLNCVEYNHVKIADDQIAWLACRKDISIHSGPYKTPTSTAMARAGARMRMRISADSHPGTASYIPIPGESVYVVSEEVVFEKQDFNPTGFYAASTVDICLKEVSNEALHQ